MAFAVCDKIDTHVHLSRFGMGDPEKTYFAGCGEILPHLQKQHIVKAILMSGGEHGKGFPGNEECRAAAEADPQHYAWMCALDPEAPETVYERLSLYRSQGAVGIGEVMINRRFDDPFLRRVFEAAGKLGLPITFHMSPGVGISYGIVDDPGLPLLEQALADFPDTLFVGHSKCFWIEISGDAPTDPKGRNRSGTGQVAPGGRIAALMEKYPNLYADLSASSGSSAVLRDPEYGPGFLETFSERLFFATDTLNARNLFPLGAWLDAQAEAGKLSREAYEKICYQNAATIYKL